MSYEDDIFYLEPDDGSKKGFRKAAGEIGARADAEIAELRRDAERMRRLDEHWVRRLVAGEVSEGQAAKATGLDRVELRKRADELDAAIDAARGGE